MKKNETILKTVFLFLFAVFLLQGCRTEIETTENANSQTLQSKIKINRITKEQFDKNETLKINLDKFISKKSKQKTTSKEIYNEYYDFSIITDDITEVNNSGTKTYTFLIKRDENQQGIALENLLMYPDKEGYSFSLIQYKLSDTEYKSYLKGEEVDFKGKVNVVKLASDKISISARLFPCWETYSTWVPYDPDAPPRYIYYPDGSYRIDTDGHYEYVTTLGTCDDGQTGFTGSVSTVPTGGGIASGTTADLKILNELIKKMYNSNAAEYNKVQWLLSSGELQDFLKIYIGPYYEDSGKTTESVLFSKFLTNFCYENRDSVTKEQVYKWFIDSYSPQYLNNLTKLTSAQLQKFVDINKEIDASPYEEEYINETNQLFVAFAISGFLDNQNEANFNAAKNSICCPTPAVLDALLYNYNNIKVVQANYIKLKFLYPNWDTWTLMYYASRDSVHTLLQNWGVIPVIGEIFDITDGTLYVFQGDKFNAALSYSSAIPVAGWAAFAGRRIKIAVKTIELANGYKATLKFFQRADNIITFGNRGQLRTVLGLVTGDARQAHHIIPWELFERPTIQKAAVSSKAFHLNDKLNGIPLETLVHNGSHPQYNNLIDYYLTKFNNANPNATPDECYDFLNTLIDKIKIAVKNNPNVKINDLKF